MNALLSALLQAELREGYTKVYTQLLNRSMSTMAAAELQGTALLIGVKN